MSQKWWNIKASTSNPIFFKREREREKKKKAMKNLNLFSMSSVKSVPRGFCLKMLRHFVAISVKLLG